MADNIQNMSYSIPNLLTIYDIKHLKKFNIEYRKKLNELKLKKKSTKSLINMLTTKKKHLLKIDWTKFKCIHGEVGYLYDISDDARTGDLPRRRCEHTLGVNCYKCIINIQDPDCTDSPYDRVFFPIYNCMHQIIDAKEQLAIYETNLTELKQIIIEINDRIRKCQLYHSTACMCCIKKKQTLIQICSNSHMCCEDCLEKMCEDNDNCKFCETIIINKYCQICNNFGDNYITDICGNRHNMCLDCLDSIMKINGKCPYCRDDIIVFDY